MKLKSSFLFLALTPLLLNAQQAVVYVGSDWCAAGTSIEKIWSSETFKTSAGVETAVYDVLEKETPESKEALKSLEKFRVPVSAYPAFAYFDKEGRCVFKKEALPFNTSREQLLALVEKGKENGKKLETLLAENTPDACAEAILMTLDGFGVNESKRANAMKAAWDKLAQLDKDDESGWRFSFTFNPYSDVYKVQGFAKNKKFSEGEEFIKSFETENKMRHASTNQKQGLKLFYYVLYKDVPERAEYCKEILREVAAADPNTFYGVAARGILANMGEGEALTHELPEELPKELKTRAVVENAKPYRVPATTKTAKKYPTAFKFAASAFSQETLNEIAARENGRKFLNGFFNDGVWLENFFSSGPAKGGWDKALSALDEICANVPVKTSADKKWATAIALNAADFKLLACVQLFKAAQWARGQKLFARGADAMPVAMMRYVLSPGQITGEDLLFLAKKYNVRPRDYSGACWRVNYRNFNFFGDSVQGPKYYMPWNNAWPRQECALYVGAVCGGLSYFGSASAKAHGVPSVPGGQPSHCAYSLWSPTENRWWICNYVNRYTGTHFNLYGFSYQFLDMQTDVFCIPASTRISSMRALWKARLAEETDVPVKVSRGEKTDCTVYATWRADKLPPADPEKWKPLAQKRVDENVADFDVFQDGKRDFVLLKWTGTYDADADTEAEFSLASDDGSRLLVNGKTVIDNDGRHDMKKAVTGKAILKKGKNPFELQYFNKQAGAGLELKLLGTGTAFSPETAALFEKAVKISPSNYDAWLAFEKYLAKTGAPAAVWKKFAFDCARGLSPHLQVAWDLLEKNAVPAVKNGVPADEFVEFLCDLHKIIRQGERPTAEFCDYGAILTRNFKKIDPENTEHKKQLLCAMLEGQYGTKQAFAATVQWGGKMFLTNEETASLYVDALGSLLKSKNVEEGSDLSKFVTNSIREASQADNFEAFKSLVQLARSLAPEKNRPQKDLKNFTDLPLLSAEGMLRISTTSQWDHPESYLDIIDDKVSTQNFHTGKEKNPWAMVRLPGEAMVGAVLLENLPGQNSGRCLPFKIEVSEDQKNWTAVTEKITDRKNEYQITFPPVRARYVRVIREGEHPEFLHFKKFMVFGTKLY